MAGSDREAQGAPLRLPRRFHTYVNQAISERQSCLAGTVTDDDGMYQKPVVVLATGRLVTWTRYLDGLEDTYQSRATHCVLGDNALYVLLQSDTQAPQTLSQTLLSVARLDLEGNVQAVRPIDIPEATHQAYSASVADVPADFSWRAGQLIVKGQYVLMGAPDARTPFTLSVDPERLADSESVHGN